MLKVKARDLAGAFRCGEYRRYRGIMRKVPGAESSNDAQMIASAITAADGNVDAISSIISIPISYRDYLTVRAALYNKIVKQNMKFKFKELISALYDITDFPTDATKELRKREDILLFSRFFYSNDMTPEPYEKLNDTVMAGCVSVEDEHDIIYKGIREFKRTRKEGRKRREPSCKKSNQWRDGHIRREEKLVQKERRNKNERRKDKCVGDGRCVC